MKPYAQPVCTSAAPLTLEDLALLVAGRRAAEEVIGKTCKGGRIYERHPRLVADINRTGKRFVAALGAVLSAAQGESRRGANQVG